ncbi:MAG TPA: ABC transporter ATP-binding protein [Anaerolineales bacterium]|nr:ABC transporter ATP-binding protein [Anaerolineales bacterium]
MSTSSTTLFDFRHTLSPNRLAGLWGMLAGFRLTYAGAVLNLALSTCAKTATFLLIRYLVDDVLQQPDRLGLLPLIALGFISLALMEGGFTFLSGRLAARTAENTALRLRNYLFDHIQRLSFTYHDRTPTGDLIQRVTSDVDAVRRFFSEQAIGIGRIALLFTVNWVALLSLNVPLALASVVVVPIILVMSVFFFRRVSKAYEQYQEQDARLSTVLQENLTGVRVVKAFARQAYEREKFERENWEKFRRGKRFLLLHTVFWPVADLLCSSQMLAGFTYGALMVMNGALSLGEYLAYMGLVVLLIWPMRELGRLIVQASTGLVSYGRLMEIVREDREPIEEGIHTLSAGSRLRGILEFHHVGFEYEAESRVLKDISFSVRPGQVVALLGPTGSGKTSLVNLLPRFYEYTRGSITLDGIELKDYPRQYLRRQIGIVEQEPFLFSRTLRENITYGMGRDVTDAEVEAAARAAAIHDVILSFPEGYNTLVGEKGITLSGGQKQRMAIARTLLKDPRLLILDDSTSSVDTETEAAIREALERLMAGRTTLVIAHRIQSVMNADLILVLEGGGITQRGTHEQLLAERDGLYRRIYDLQARIEVEVEKEVTAFDAPPREETEAPEREAVLA